MIKKASNKNKSNTQATGFHTNQSYQRFAEQANKPTKLFVSIFYFVLAYKRFERLDHVAKREVQFELFDVEKG